MKLLVITRDITSVITRRAGMHYSRQPGAGDVEYCG
jgi:hypothetical protein